MTRLAAIALALLVCLPAGPSVAQVQDDPNKAQAEQIAAERAWLFEALRTAPSEAIGRAIEEQIWRFWMGLAPDQESADLMNKAMERRRDYDFAGAVEILDKLVAHAPGWSEAWNQRATVLFYQEKYDASLEDIEKVLTLEPKHFGAIAGKAVILMRQGRMELGQKALRAAIALDPWLKERDMLIAAPGKDL